MFSLEQNGALGLALNTDESLKLLTDTYIAGLHGYKTDK